MNQTKIEKWAGHEIRFVLYKDEWWAVAKDVASALEYIRERDAITQHCRGAVKHRVGVVTGKKRDGSDAVQFVNAFIIPEQDIYRLAFRSQMEEAEVFQDWVINIIKELRQAIGLESYEVFRMLDKEHQKQASARLNNGLRQPTKQDFIKANTIANKAVSNKFGLPKMISKDEMTIEMLKEREPILDSIVNLINLNEEFNLGVSISETVYDKFC